MDELPIGRRVAYWRQRRRMSQQVFADRLGKSKSWVDKVERGVRQLDRFSVMHGMADVLLVDLQTLLGREARRSPGSLNCIDQVEVEAIRAALEQYDRISAFFEPQQHEPVPLDELVKAVGHAWMTYQHARYGLLARMLPKLLRDAQAADAAHDPDTGQRAASLLAQVYQIATSTLRKLGEPELGWLAADRAIAVAQRSGDPLIAAVATTRVANALLSLGRARPALELNVSIAHKIAPADGAGATPQVLSVYGSLLLQGVMAAARSGDTATVRDLLKEATEAADLVGCDANHYWTSFGPTNVALHRAAAAVELGEGRLAVETHERMDRDGFAGLLPERRAHHLLDLARGYAQIGDIGQAAGTLLEADRLAPSEIRCRPVAHEVMTDVLRRGRETPPQALFDLADNMGIAV